MASTAWHFPVFILASLAAFLAILHACTRRRAAPPRWGRKVVLAAIVVVAGMVFAKLAQQAGLPWWIYYGVPAATALALPPVALRFDGRELATYLVLTAAYSPAIHVLFSLLLDWHEYMPFIRVPYLFA